MRTRIRVLFAVARHRRCRAGVVAAPAFAQETGSSSRSSPTRRPRSATSCSKRASTVDDCQKAPNPLVPRANEIIWGSLAFLVLLGVMWKFGVPAVKNMEQAREDRIRNDLEGAEKARTEAEAEKAQYLAQIADARERGRSDHRGGAAVGRAGAARSDRAGRGGRERDPGSGPRPTSRTSSNAGDGRAPHRRRPALDRSGRAHRRAQPRQRHATASSSTASSTRSGATDRWPTASTRYAQAMLEIAQAEGHLDEVEDELFRFARIVEGNDDLRMALSNPGLPADRRAAIVDELLENRALQTDPGDRGVHRRRGARPRPARDRRPVRRARGAEPRARGCRSALGGRRSTTRRCSGSPRRCRRATDKHIEVKVVVDRPSSAGSSPRSATR